MSAEVGMSVIDDLISTLKRDSPVREVRTCVLWTAVVSHQCGLASTSRDEEMPFQKPVRDVGRLDRKSALKLAGYAKSQNPLEASIGLAAINSLLEIDESHCVELNAKKLIMERGKGRKVAIVGHFPFVPEVREAAERLWVLEKRPDEGDLPASAAAEVLPQADVVAITGASLINHTFEGLMELCRPEALVIVLGPTTPLSPVLFDYGVDTISGIKVVDVEMVLRYISQGASFKQLKGIKLLTMTKSHDI